MAACGGLFQFEEYLNYYTRDDLTQFLTRLKKHAPTNRIAMSFSFDNHKTILGYDGGDKKWMFIEANELPGNEILLKNIADKIFEAHTFDDKPFHQAPFSIRFYALGNQLNYIQHFAMRLNQDSQFRHLQKIKPNHVLKRTKSKSTLFHLAADYGCQNTINMILDLPTTNANKKNKNRETPLYCAAENGHYEVVKALLKHKFVKVNAKNKYGETALYVASENGREKIVDLLLRHYADPDIISDDNLSSITVAASKNHLSVLRLFSKYNIDLFKRDENQKTTVDYARENHNQEMIHYLQQMRIKQSIHDSKTTAYKKHNLFSSSLNVKRKPDTLLQSFNNKKIKLTR